MKKFLTLTLALFGLAATASAQWSSEGPIYISPMGHSGDDMVKADQAENGDFYVSWIETQGGYNLNVRMQRLDKDGNALWDKGGIGITNQITMSWCGDYDCKATPDGGAVVVWGDSRKDPEVRQSCIPYAYKVDKDGNQLWGLNGLELPCDGTGMTYSIFPIGEDVIVGYHSYADGDAGSDMKYKVCKISGDGVILWTKDIAGTWGHFVPTSDGYWLIYMTSKLVAQRFDSDGKPMFEDPITIQSTGAPDRGYVNVKADGNDGFFVAYRRLLEHTGLACIQHVEADGSKTMGLRAVDLYGTNEDGQHSSTIALGFKPDKQEVLCAWEMTVSGSELRTNKLSFDGEYLLPEETGRRIAFSKTAGKADWGFTACEVVPLEDGWMLLYGETNAWADVDLVAAKLDNDGNVVFKNVLMPSQDIMRTQSIVNDNDRRINFFWNINNTNKNSLNSASVRAISISYDGKMEGATGIQEVADKKVSAPEYYRLDGTKIDKPSGVCIVRDSRGNRKINFKN